MRFKLILFLGLITNLAFGQLVINEFLASNNNKHTDNFNQYNDWVEIYNSSDSAIDMGGMFFTDNLLNGVLYQIPISNPKKTTIPSKGFLVYWFDKDIEQGCLHVNLRLNSDGEQIGLYSSDGKTLVDKVTFPKQKTDVSYGRHSNNSWKYFIIPTPNKSNTTTTYNGILNSEPSFSIEGGFYNTSLKVSINTDIEGGTIHYTTDGSDPNINSKILLGLITIDSTTVIRAKILKNRFIASSTITQTYFVKESFKSRGLPVFSISSNPDYFWDQDSGIYVQNFKPSWEYPINIEFFENDGNLAFNEKASIKIIGDNSWKLPQKMLSISFNNNINYPLLNNFSRRVYNSFNLRCSGSDWASTLFRDGLGQSLTNNGMDVDIQGFRPSIVFINGLYMGIHNIRQKINNNYIEQKYLVKSKDLDIVENQFNTDEMEVVEGNDYAYQELFYKFENADFSKESEYQEITKVIDINNFIDYIIVEIYVANHSWGHNIALWKPKKNRNSKWRWFLADLDRGFEYHKIDRNYIEFVSGSDKIPGDNPYWTTIFLDKLFKNEQFRGLFTSKLSDYLYITLHINSVKKDIRSFKAKIENEISNHINRWKGSKSSYGNGLPTKEFWNNEIKHMLTFAEKRGDYIRKHLIDKLKLKEAVNLNISITAKDAGKVSINDLIVPEDKWNGLYLQDVPVTFTAIANRGYKFLYWTGSSLEDSTIYIFTETLNEDKFIVAHFAKDTIPQIDIIINEINYSSSLLCNTGDWIELYNPNNYPIDISYWKIDNEDINDRFTFPNNTIIKGDEYIVVCNDILNFQYLYPKVKAIGNTAFGLEKDRDIIKIFDDAENLIDIVSYSTGFEWPNISTIPGQTLELFSSDSDNSKGRNWVKGYNIYGTPGASNSINSIYLDEIPHQEINSGKEFSKINLNNYLHFPLSEIYSIQWSASKNRNIKISIDNYTNIASISYLSGWKGSEKIVFTCTDKFGNLFSDSVRFSVGTIISDSICLNCIFTKDNSPYIIQNTITVPIESILRIESGTEIYMHDEVDISILGQLIFNGTSNAPIYLTAQNNSWGGIFFDSTNQESIINYVIFSHSKHGKDSSIINATISSYHSELKISNSVFKNNIRSIYGYFGAIHIDNCTFYPSTGEKINLQYSNSIVENNTLHYTYGDNDAIDFDGVNNGIVRNNMLYGGEDDGIDIGKIDSTSCKGIQLTENKIHGFLDKGISIGEGSKDINIAYNIITSSRNGIAVKDFSTANIEHNTLYKNTFGVSCYEKNYDQGGGFASISNSILSNSIIASIHKDDVSELEIQYCLSDIELITGNYNIMNKAMFMSIKNYDFNLQKNSPCINKGDPLYQLDQDGTITDIGALPYYTKPFPKSLFIFFVLFFTLVTGRIFFIILRRRS